MIRVALIGAGDITYHFEELLGMSKADFDKHVEVIAKALVGSQPVLLPDRGAPFEVATKFTELGGTNVIATIPLKDIDFGIKHLEKYMDARVDNKKVIDSTIDTENWYKQDMTICTFGDVILMLGNSLGSMSELTNGFYLYKLFKGDKPDVAAIREKIHPQIRAGKNMPFTVVVYEPFMQGKLPQEIESYIVKFGGKVEYADEKSIMAAIAKMI